MPSERDLIRRCLTGDVDAFRRLVEPHQDFIYGIALSVLRNREEAEEAAQDALLRIYQGLGSFRGEVPFRSWAYRIAVRVSFNVHRRGRRRRDSERVTDPDRIDRMDSGDARTPDVDAEQEEVRRRLGGIIERLPRKLHEVVVLSYLREWSHVEIAEVLEIPEGTVKSRLYLARVRIRKEAKRRGILE